MRKRLHDWDGLIAELNASGLSRAEFCRQRRLKYQTMSKWILRQSQSRPPATSERGTADKSRAGGKVGRRRSARGSASGSTNGPDRPDPARFAEVSVRLGSAACMYEIVLGAGRSIRVPSGFEADAVARLIQVVESC